MGKAIGIDLGTTNTVVAVLLDGRPQVVEDDKGYRVLPSVVTLDEFGTATVGHAARNRILTDPDRTVYAVKRLMGRRFDSEQAVEARQRVGYKILPADDGNCLLQMGSQALSPIDASAMVLRTAREMAERAIGEPVEEAVITVPAYFNHQQRTATFQAAKVAGLRCDRLLNEPTAAALAYGFRRDSDRTIVVYDLGGGTFDVSVLHLSDGVYEILATKGDTYLGGEDFDYRLVDYLADHFQTQTGFDLREDRTALQRIKDAAERAKCELSFTDRTTVLVPRLTTEHNLELAVTRLTLESLVEDLVERTLDVTRRSLADAGLQLSDIDDVLLVGGQTRMPRVREAISGLFGREPSRGVHPEEVVAIGAAVHAASLTDDKDAPQHVLIDVTPFDLGIDVIGGLFQPIISRNTHVPTSETRTFATSQDDQEAVRITVRQGDSRFADENEFLGEFIMSGLTPAARMQTKVEVTFRIDSNGMLHASAVEPATGESRRITVRNYGEVAQTKGATSPQIETDGKPDVVLTPGKSGARKTAAPAGPGSPVPDAAGAKKRGGFLAGIFGRGKKSDTPAEQPAAQPPPVETAPAEAEGPGINLPDVEPLEELEELPIDALPPANIEDEPLGEEPIQDLGGEFLEPVAEPDQRGASIGMAGGGHDAWKDAPAKDSFTLPAYDDEDDDDHDVPVGLAGGGFDDRLDDMFAMPDDDDPSSDIDDALMGDELFGSELSDLGADQLAPMDEAADASTPVEAEADDDPFASLAEDIFGNIGDEVANLAAAAEPGAEPTIDEIAPLEHEPDTGELFDFTAPADGSQEGAAFMLPPPEPLEAAGADDEDDAASDEIFGLPGTVDDPSEVFGLPGFDDGDDAEAQEALANDLFSEPGGLPPRHSEGDDEKTEIFARSPGPSSSRDSSRKKRRRRKPARLKLAYRRVDAMVTEYRENLRRGGCFVKTSKPLPVGRECIIEVRAPGMDEPLSLTGVVTWSSVGLSSLPDGQDPGMGIEYRLDDDRRGEIENVLSALGA